jgi:hypothetical protein
MPIVITPTGQFIDSVTGNPVDLPPQRPDLPMQKMAGAMSDREREMIGQAAMPEMIGQMANPSTFQQVSSGAMSDRLSLPMTVVDQVNALMAMGLTEDQALEAIAIERSAGRVDPQNFSGAKSDVGMGALSGVPAGNETPMTMPTPRPEDLMMRQMEDGRDRTFNPRDAINSYNAPNT